SMNDSVNPVKMYTYALLGKPVLGMAIRELVSRPDIAQVAANPETFGRMIPQVLALSQNSEHQARLREFALRNTWNQRAELAMASLKPFLTPCKEKMAQAKVQGAAPAC